MQSRIYFGATSSPTPPSEDKIVFQRVTLSEDNVTTKQFTLNFTPASVSDISAWIIDGGTFTPGFDFTVTGNLIDYSLSSYAPVLVAGQQIQFIYKRT